VSVLSRLHTRLSIDAFDVAHYVVNVAPASTLAELEARDASFAAALAEIDETMTRVMRIELDTALADDTSLPTPTRKVFAGTIAAYAGKVDVLAQRVREQAARGGAPNVEAVAAAVEGAARKTLALRDALRTKVLVAAEAAAREAVADADRQAKDRTLDDATRKQWSAMRRELEITASDPMRVTRRLAERLAIWPEQIDEGEPEREVTFADMIELD
jgi:hypothetical protein